MTLLFMDSYAAGDLATKWTASSGTWTVQTSTPRTSGASYLQSVTTNPTHRKTIAAASEVFTGFGVYSTTNSIANAWYVTLRGDSNATSHITVRQNASGKIEALRGTTGGTIVATGATTLSASTWYYIEVRGTIDDSTGVIQVRINGSTSNEINFSGDTKNAGTNTTIDSVELGANAAATHAFADAYINDTNGSVNNTWEGDVKAVYLIPTGDGNSSQLTGSDGNQVSNYQQVDETPTSGTDYNGDSTVGHGDTYAMTDLGAGVTVIKALQWVGFIAKSDAGAVAAKRRIRSASTNYTGSSLTLSTSYQSFLEILETDPATSAAWTASGVNALEAGMEVA